MIGKYSNKNNAIKDLRKLGTAFAKVKADGINQEHFAENDMHRSRYDDRYWESRFDRALRGRTGFAWGAFFIGFILGGIIF